MYVVASDLTICMSEKLLNFLPLIGKTLFEQIDLAYQKLIYICRYMAY